MLDLVLFSHLFVQEIMTLNTSCCRTEPGIYSVDSCVFHNAHDRFRKRGPDDSGNMSFFGEDISNGNEDFMVLNSFNRNGEQKDVSRVDRDEEEFRHPLAREVSRLRELRSAWNPKLEEELRQACLCCFAASG